MIGTISIIVIILGIVGFSYAYWLYIQAQTTTNLVTTGCFRFIFEEQANSNIQLLEAYPISDEDGKKLTPYTFTIRNECAQKAKYTIRLEIDQISTMNEKYIKSLLNTNLIKKVSELKETTPSLKQAKKSYILEELTINANEEKNYELRLWIDGGVNSENTEVMNKTFEGKVTIEADYDTKYTENILNGTDPVIKDGLIPVTIAANGEVRKADENSEWYSYEKKNWANAVILTDESVSYQENEIIPETNIESYFVWIPRYRYQIFDKGLYANLTNVEQKEQEIKIEFESKEQQIKKGTKEGDWLTHPAFTAFDTNGMWVGKFETSFLGATNSEDCKQNIIDASKITIKPNVHSWRGIQIINAFENSYQYKREYDSHMMKNTEWGAVAFLSHSKYGQMASIRINNNSDYITGYASVTEPTCGYTGTNEECNQYNNTAEITKPYNTEVGYLASTTGNISGIYDMSGGSYEYVMSVMTDKEGKPLSGKSSSENSGFNGTYGNEVGNLSAGKAFPNSKYYDTYGYLENNMNNASIRILGDATGEMGPFGSKLYSTNSNYTRHIGSWYADEIWAITNNAPWMLRGSSVMFGQGAGIFAFSSGTGAQEGMTSFRVVFSI